MRVGVDVKGSAHCKPEGQNSKQWLVMPTLFDLASASTNRAAEELMIGWRILNVTPV